MRTSFKSVVAGVVTLVVAGVLGAAGASSASAAAAPFDPDPSAYGSIIFHDATGAVVTSGDATNPLSMAYAESSVAPPAGNTTGRANLKIYLPVPAQPTGLWGGIQLNGNTVYPIPTAPAPLNTSTHAETAMLATSSTVAQGITGFIPNTAAGYVNLWQMRLVSVTGLAYAATTISVDPATNIWTQTYPVPVKVTTTALTGPGSNPADAPASPTLTATVTGTPVPAGTVQFFNGATSLGTSSTTAGVATLPQSGLVAATYNLTAVFTPTDGVSGASSSPAVAYVVQVPRTPVTVGLSATAAPVYLGAPVTFTANALAGTPAAAVPGTFEFFDGATSLGAASTTATLTTSTLALGAHSVTVNFIPTDLTTYNNLTTANVSVNVLAVVPADCNLLGSHCSDPQNFTVEVVAGALVISTPFGPTTPFNLGKMALNATATELQTPFTSFKSQDSFGRGITITDTRGGNNPWTAQLQSGKFVSTTPGTLAQPATDILPSGLGFTGVAGDYSALTALKLGSVVYTDHPADSVDIHGAIAAHGGSGLTNASTFATAAIGVGTVYVDGMFNLNAPTSTRAGIYNGTVTFTIS